MNDLPLFLLLLMPGLIGTVTAAVLAPKLNRQWRERREAAASRNT
ncbi:hypothetical protein [Microbacterium sp. C7(2022)]|nr:hypothetical protein [Microbacterium sp. C7(2022)]MDE0547557.1 hypothetical protein [Microbacterium sp. C7(2022)]